eukprot:TRINITY_DN659_c0_g1_i1.p1 TRINITY_DN659_c0_g1~~TRINITY_DN659_c0_g1_i1.p1  ORF type:complete len:511 (+),score=108.46 TRINITY_DN659_c0_g1_i1:225-1757(+)
MNATMTTFNLNSTTTDNAQSTNVDTPQILPPLVHSQIGSSTPFLSGQTSTGAPYNLGLLPIMQSSSLFSGYPNPYPIQQTSTPLTYAGSKRSFDRMMSTSSSSSTNPTSTYSSLFSQSNPATSFTQTNTSHLLASQTTSPQKTILYPTANIHVPSYLQSSGGIGATTPSTTTTIGGGSSSGFSAGSHSLYSSGNRTTLHSSGNGSYPLLFNTSTYPSKLFHSGGTSSLLQSGFGSLDAHAHLSHVGRLNGIGLSNTAPSTSTSNFSTSPPTSSPPPTLRTFNTSGSFHPDLTRFTPINLIDCDNISHSNISNNNNNTINNNINSNNNNSTFQLNIGDKNTAPKKAKERKKPDRFSGLTELIEFGLVIVGDKLYFKTEVEDPGEITEDGTIKWNALDLDINKFARNWASKHNKEKPNNGWNCIFYNGKNLQYYKNLLKKPDFRPPIIPFSKKDKFHSNLAKRPMQVIEVEEEEENYHQHQFEQLLSSWMIDQPSTKWEFCINVFMNEDSLL